MKKEDIELIKEITEALDSVYSKSMQLSEDARLSIIHQLLKGSPATPTLNGVHLINNELKQIIN